MSVEGEMRGARHGPGAAAAGREAGTAGRIANPGPVVESDFGPFLPHQRGTGSGPGASAMP